MKTRAISGVFFVAAVIAAVYFSVWSFVFLFGIIMVLGQWEFYTLARIDNASADRYSGIISGLLLFSAAFAVNLLHVNEHGWHSHVVNTVIFAGIALFIPFITELFRTRKNPFRNLGWTVLGVVYIALPFSLMNSLMIGTEETHFPWLLLGFFFIVWANDTGAYCVGKLIGKTKLFERVSPNKTWEGSIGGLVFGLATAYGMSYVDSPESMNLTTLHWLMIGLITVVFGALGDLVQSRMKRSLGVKDSGKILPGHGGVLDRFDAAIFATPFVFAYMRLFVF